MVLLSCAFVCLRAFLCEYILVQNLLKRIKIAFRTKDTTSHCEPFLMKKKMTS